MAIVHYFDIDEMRDGDIKYYLQHLPDFMHYDVMKYRNINDQKSRLAARLMLCESLRASGMSDWQYKWKKNNYNKPYIEDWHPFNISHSGNLVILSYADSSIGVDIEKIQCFQYSELLKYFHEAEQELISNSENKLDIFYELWVKKEAFLKARGTGLVDGLNAFDCTCKAVIYQGNYWHFHSIDIHPDYKGCLCLLNKHESITIRAFRLVKYKTS